LILSPWLIVHHRILSPVADSTSNNLSNSSPSLFLSEPVAPDHRLKEFQTLGFLKCTDFENLNYSSPNKLNSCHIFLSGNLLTMESDYKESTLKSTNTQDKVDITQLFAMLSSQITSQNNHLQEQIMQNDLKISQNFLQVVQAHDNFKQEV